MNDNVLKELRLKPEIIARDMNISIGLAKTYSHRSDKHEDNTNALMIAATYFRRAAANALLLGDYAEARDLFLQASRNYQRIGLPYSVILASLSSEGHGNVKSSTYSWLEGYIDHKIADGAFPQLAYVVLALSSFKSINNSFEWLSSVRRSLDPYRLSPLGVLGISVGTMLDLFDSLVPEIGQRKIQLAEAMAPFFGAYNAAIRQTMHNHYHWERLALPFHPAEPDVYGVLTLVDSALKLRHELRIEKFIEQAAIAWESKNLLSTILKDMSINQQDKQNKEDGQGKEDKEDRQDRDDTATATN